MEQKMELYKEKLLRLKHFPLEKKNIEAASIICDAYQQEYKRKNGHSDNNFVIVGGLSVEYYTAGQYATADIDLVLSSRDILDSILKNLAFAKEGRHWFREDLDLAVENPSSYFTGDHKRNRIILTESGYEVQVTSPEDIFSDRLKAVVNWGEAEQIKWLNRLWESEKLDLDYIRHTALSSTEEISFFDDYVNFQENESQEAIQMEQAKTRYIDVYDGSIDEIQYPEILYLPLTNSLMVPPDEQSKNEGKYAKLQGYIDDALAVFQTASENYYSSDAETGFTIDDIQLFDSKEITPKEFRTLLNKIISD